MSTEGGLTPSDVAAEDEREDALGFAELFKSQEDVIRDAADEDERVGVTLGAAAAQGDKASMGDRAKGKLDGATVEGEPSSSAMRSISMEDTEQNVDEIFNTLHMYSDLASRKAVDTMVIQGLKNSKFTMQFALKLFESMEREENYTSQRECMKLLRWSCYLLELKPLPEISFTRMVNAQIVLCHVLMDGKKWFLRFCKKQFMKLFKSREILEMYIDVLRALKSRLQAKESLPFLKLFVDSVVSNPQLLVKYKHVLLELYITTIINSNEHKIASSPAFQGLLSKIEVEDFDNIVLIASLRVLGKNPEVALQSVGCLLKFLSIDLSGYGELFMPTILGEVRHFDERRRDHALAAVGILSEKSKDLKELPSMLDRIKAILEGFEGELSRPFHRIGMLKALAQLSRSKVKEQIRILAPSVASYLVTCYKSEAIDEVKVAILLAMRTWISKSDKAVQADLISFIKTGLEESGNLRMAHLNLIRVICKTDSLPKVLPLLDQLIDLAKAGFTNTDQRVSGLCSLFAISAIVTVDTEAESNVMSKDLWRFIGENEPSLISIEMLSRLPDEYCLITLDLVESLLVKHMSRIQQHFNIRSLLQLLIYMDCHPSWGVRKIAKDATRGILKSRPALSEDILIVFFNWLSILEERSHVSTDMHQPIKPSSEILVRCLCLIAPDQMADHLPEVYSKYILCCHHPALINTRFLKRLKQQDISSLFDCSSIISIMKDLLSHNGYRGGEHLHYATNCSMQMMVEILPDSLPSLDQVDEAQQVFPNEALPSAGGAPQASSGTSQTVEDAEDLSGSTESSVPTSSQTKALAGTASSIESTTSAPFMNDEGFISFLKAAANAALSSITTANVFVATCLLTWADDTSTSTKVIMCISLFIFLPWAVATAGIAHCAEHDDSWRGWAATMVLMEFIYGIILGGCLAAALIQVQEKIIGVSSALLAIGVVWLWTYCFSHPKWLKRIHFWNHHQILSQEAQARGVSQPLPSFMSKLRKWFKGEVSQQDPNGPHHSISISP